MAEEEEIMTDEEFEKSLEESAHCASQRAKKEWEALQLSRVKEPITAKKKTLTIEEFEKSLEESARRASEQAKKEWEALQRSRVKYPVTANMKTLSLEEWTKMVETECMRCGYPGLMSAYLETDEAKEAIKNHYENEIEDYKAGRISWEQLTIGAVDSLAYCLNLMCE